MTSITTTKPYRRAPPYFFINFLFFKTWRRTRTGENASYKYSIITMFITWVIDDTGIRSTWILDAKLSLLIHILILTKKEKPSQIRRRPSRGRLAVKYGTARHGTAQQQVQHLGIEGSLPIHPSLTKPPCKSFHSLILLHTDMSVINRMGKGDRNIHVIPHPSPR